MFLKNYIKVLNDIVTIDTTIGEVISIMSEENLHHIVIVKDKKPIGLLTEKDIVRLYKKGIDFSQKAIDYAIKNLITLHNGRLAQHALNMMIDNNIRKIVVINRNGEYQGCVEQEDIVYHFEDELRATNGTVYNLLDASNIAYILDEDSTLDSAMDIMVNNAVTSVLISQDSNPVGIISESDILKLARDNISLNKSVKEFMHSPLITISMSSSINDMIALMKEKCIRKVVVQNENGNSFHILSSRDFINNIKGNYTSFLESKLFDARDTFNALSEYVIELIDLKDEQVIYWVNGITKDYFDANIDDPVTKIIPKDIWDRILSTLVKEKIFYDEVRIGEKVFQIKAHYGTMLDDDIIKLFLNDITKITNLNNDLRKQNLMQEQLLFSQAKMVQMGEMIGNIAHQWRQPLSLISTSASGMQLKHDFDDLSKDELVELTNIIVDQSEYLSKTIDTFRNFIKEKKELRYLKLQDRLDIALSIITTTLNNKHINIINEIPYDKPIELKMVVGEIDQVIINIINNAKDALLEKNINDPWVKISLDTDETKVSISIEDNAGGVPNDILPKIFDQYFSTKDEKEGTGLGLFMSKKIIQESFFGDISALNTEKGAKFKIILPLDHNKKIF